MPLTALDVMVVDDSESMRQLYRTCLTAFGVAAVRTHDSARDALAAARRTPPDLAIVDWRMGPPTGFDFLRRLRCTDMAPACLTTVIMVSGHASREFVEKAMLAGSQHFLAKPVSPRVLLERIEWVTEDERQLVRDGDRYVIDGIAEWLERSDRVGGAGADDPRPACDREVVKL